MRILSLMFSALVVASCLSGCATSPTPLDKAAAVPSSRIYYKQSDSQNAATVIIVRDTGFLAGGVSAHFFIDNREAAAIDSGEIVRLRIAPGSFVFGVRLTGPHNPFSIDQSIEAHNTYYYRITVDDAGARILHMPNP